MALKAVSGISKRVYETYISDLKTTFPYVTGKSVTSSTGDVPEMPDGWQSAEFTATGKIIFAPRALSTPTEKLSLSHHSSHGKQQRNIHSSKVS